MPPDVGVDVLGPPNRASIRTPRVIPKAVKIEMIVIPCSLTLNRPGGGGIRPQAGSSLCCAETLSSRKLKLSDFYYILIGLNSEYKPVP